MTFPRFPAFALCLLGAFDPLFFEQHRTLLIFFFFFSAIGLAVASDREDDAFLAISAAIRPSVPLHDHFAAWSSPSVIPPFLLRFWVSSQRLPKSFVCPPHHRFVLPLLFPSPGFCCLISTRLFRRPHLAVFRHSQVFEEDVANPCCSRPVYRWVVFHIADVTCRLLGSRFPFRRVANVPHLFSPSV